MLLLLANRSSMQELLFLLGQPLRHMTITCVLEGSTSKFELVFFFLAVLFDLEQLFLATCDLSLHHLFFLLVVQHLLSIPQSAAFLYTFLVLEQQCSCVDLALHLLLGGLSLTPIHQLAAIAFLFMHFLQVASFPFLGLLCLTLSQEATELFFTGLSIGYNVGGEVVQEIHVRGLSKLVLGFFLAVLCRCAGLIYNQPGDTPHCKPLQHCCLPLQHCCLPLQHCWLLLQHCCLPIQEIDEVALRWRCWQWQYWL